MENDESGSVIRVEINGKTWETRNAGLILGSLGDVEQGEPTNDDPDDTVNQGVAGSEWVTFDRILTVEDAQVSVMALRANDIILRTHGGRS